MKLAYVVADRGVSLSGTSGSAVHVREFATALAARGTAVTLFTACPPDEATCAHLPFAVVDLTTDPVLRALRQQVSKNLRARACSPAHAWELYSLLLNQILLEQLTQHRAAVDAVYERQSLWSVAGLQFARRHDLPFFLEVNAPLLAQQQAYRELAMIDVAAAIERLVIPAADRLLLTSPVLLASVRAAGASRRQVRVLPCGVPRWMFPANGRLGVRGASEFVLGFVGSLKPWHGVDLLLEAFRQLRALDSGYRLLIVGDGPMRGEVEAFCRQHGLSRAVTLTGAVDHRSVPTWLAQIDVGLAPYPPMPAFYFSPLKLWEYAAAGVPIVASASGELPRLFPHKSAALLHPPGNVRKIVAHVERLRHDPALARRFARRARRTAKLYTWDRIAARFEAIARRAVAARGRPPGHHS